MCNIRRSGVRQSTLADELYILRRSAIRQRTLADNWTLARRRRIKCIFEIASSVAAIITWNELMKEWLEGSI